MRHLISVYTVCLQEFLFETKLKWKVHQIPLKLEMDVQFARMDNMSHLTTTPTKWPVRPAKTKINLGNCPVWSESLLLAWRNLGSLAIHWAHSEDSDQTGRDAQADLSLRWPQRSFCWFCHAVAHIWVKNSYLSCWYICTLLLSSDTSSFNSWMLELKNSSSTDTSSLSLLLSVALKNVINEPPCDKPNKMTVLSEDSDQPGHLPSLISLCCALNG